MKKIKFKKRIFLLLSLVVFSLGLFGQNYRVATFNIRLDSRSDSGNLWEDRAAAVTNLIRYHDFDIMGTQEGMHHQLELISKTLPYFARYGKGRNDGTTTGEHAAIYFKKEKFRLLKAGDFWLREDPSKPGLGWDATCCNRICSWVQLQDIKTGKKFFVFNAHFDHQGKIARVESSKLMLRKIKEIAAGMPAILTGDFNGDRESEWYKSLAASTMLRDSYKDVKYPYEPSSSFNAFGRSLNRMDVIDHIFLTRHFKATSWAILTDTYKGKFPSDHYPVLAVVQFVK